MYDTRPTSGSLNSDAYARAMGLGLAGPYFDLNYSGNVKGVLGKTAMLNCRVKNIGNKTVSWLRHQDTHLLTIGRLTYTSDMRFKAIHKLYSEDYMLQIKPAKQSDSGKYACQISTTPPNSHIVTLTIAGQNKHNWRKKIKALAKSDRIIDNFWKLSIMFFY